MKSFRETTPRNPPHLIVYKTMQEELLGTDKSARGFVLAISDCLLKKSASNNSARVNCNVSPKEAHLLSIMHSVPKWP